MTTKFLCSSAALVQPTLCICAIVVCALVARRDVSNPNGIVAAREFHLLDPQGRVRAKLGMEQGSGPALSLMDSSGKLRVALRVGNRQGAYNGLSSWEEAGLVIYGIDGEQAVRLTNIDYSPEGDWPELSFFSTGGPIMRLEGNRGQPGAAFTLRDVSGGTEAQLRVERKGADLRIKRGKDADGVSMHLGQDAADYVQISVNRADGPQVVIKNELGSEVFKKP